MFPTLTPIPDVEPPLDDEEPSCSSGSGALSTGDFWNLTLTSI